MTEQQDNFDATPAFYIDELTANTIKHTALINGKVRFSNKPSAECTVPVHWNYAPPSVEALRKEVERLTDIYLKVTDAMGYDSGKHGLQFSPEEYAESLRTTNAAQAEQLGKLEEEFNCAETALDSACVGDLEDRDFKCLGDYIAAIVACFENKLAAANSGTAVSIHDWLRSIVADGYRTDSERFMAEELLKIPFPKDWLQSSTPPEPQATVELTDACNEFRDVVLHQRGLLAENDMSSDQVNDVLNEFDHIIGSALNQRQAVKAEQWIAEALIEDPTLTPRDVAMLRDGYTAALNQRQAVKAEPKPATGEDLAIYNRIAANYHNEKPLPAAQGVPEGIKEIIERHRKTYQDGAEQFSVRSDNYAEAMNNYRAVDAMAVEIEAMLSDAPEQAETPCKHRTVTHEQHGDKHYYVCADCGHRREVGPAIAHTEASRGEEK
jgi:hypothetical protein